MFIDEVEIRVKAGKGGNGCVAFIREKFRPWGGPAGGDGGAGGDVVFQVSTNVDTLLPLYRKRILRAENGKPGGAKNCSGKSGKDLVVQVPAGTIVRVQGRDDPLCDLTEIGQRFVVAAGGKGGRGNQHFATSTHQTPHEFEVGKDGEELDLHLELKLIADVGLIGLPNAGKSTLLSRLSAATPRIAPYPFTTKEPQLGIVDLGGYRQVVMADLPGLIEGAHHGAGLGDEFLKHIERTSFLLHLVDIAPPDGSDPVENFELIERELVLYSEVLAKRPRMVVANKIELTGAEENLAKFREALNGRHEVLAVSAATGQGLPELLKRLLERSDELKGPGAQAW